MIIDRTYPIFTVRWLVIHVLAVPTVFTGGYYSFLYLLFYFPIISSIK